MSNSSTKQIIAPNLQTFVNSTMKDYLLVSSIAPSNLEKQKTDMDVHISTSSTSALQQDKSDASDKYAPGPMHRVHTFHAVQDQSELRMLVQAP